VAKLTWLETIRHHLLGAAPTGDAAMSTPQLPSLFKAFAEKLEDWKRYREAVKELSQLSDRELHDIGVNRGNIEYIARH
jgi:uncharacterized protein YjiS (DUF1127 family)